MPFRPEQSRPAGPGRPNVPAIRRTALHRLFLLIAAAAVVEAFLRRMRAGAWIRFGCTDPLGQANTAVFSRMGEPAALDAIGCRGPGRQLFFAACSSGGGVTDYGRSTATGGSGGLQPAVVADLLQVGRIAPGFDHPPKRPVKRAVDKPADAGVIFYRINLLQFNG